MKKFELTNVVLYAKGQYKPTENILNDLKVCLEADHYTPMTDQDIVLLLVSRLEDTEPQKMTAFNLANDILKSFPSYMRLKLSLEEKIAIHCLDIIRWFDNEKWDSDKKVKDLTFY